MLKRGPDIQEGTLMLRGALFFWWVRFLGRPRWSEGPRLSGRDFLVGFRTDFVTSVWFSGAFAGVFALAGLRPAGARKFQEVAPLPPPPPSLRTSLVIDHVKEEAFITNITLYSLVLMLPVVLTQLQNKLCESNFLSCLSYCGSEWNR